MNIEGLEVSDPIADFFMKHGKAIIITVVFILLLVFGRQWWLSLAEQDNEMASENFETLRLAYATVQDKLVSNSKLPKDKLEKVQKQFSDVSRVMSGVGGTYEKLSHMYAQLNLLDSGKLESFEVPALVAKRQESEKEWLDDVQVFAISSRLLAVESRRSEAWTLLSELAKTSSILATTAFKLLEKEAKTAQEKTQLVELEKTIKQNQPWQASLISQ
jgi:hypothetical protein